MTKYRLFADSGGYCQNPGCLAPIFRDLPSTTVHIAEMAHVISAADTGPRSDSTTTAAQRGAYENLILLCASCHTMIDKAEAEFPVALLLEWKAEHRQRIEQALGVRGFATRAEARRAIAGLLSENHQIWREYGPDNEQNADPESPLAPEWGRLVVEQVIPNNEHIIKILEANMHLLTEAEIDLLGAYKVHASGFALRHLSDSGVQAVPRFPADLDRILT